MLQRLIGLKFKITVHRSVEYIECILYIYIYNYIIIVLTNI